MSSHVMALNLKEQMVLFPRIISQWFPNGFNKVYTTGYDFNGTIRMISMDPVISLKDHITPGKFNVTKKKITDHVNIPKKHCLRYFVNMK